MEIRDRKKILKFFRKEKLGILMVLEFFIVIGEVKGNR